MTETAGIHFGPAWLRDTFVQPPQGVDHGSAGGGGPSKMASNLNMMAPAKLAEFRYGREEMLALFNLPPPSKSLPTYQEKAVATAGLLAERPQPPLNLMGPMSEEEQRAWQKGANSDTSLRLYKKEVPSMGPGIGRGGGVGERGRGRGRGGFFERHRPPMDDDDGMGRRGEESVRGFGRGGNRSYDRSLSDRGSWFDRSNSTSAGQPGEDGGPTNGNISPRKGYTRAPFDDWRKPPPGSNSAAAGGGGGSGGNNAGEDEDGGGWRTGPSSSGRRWNAPSGSEGGRGGGNVGGGAPGGWRSDERKFPAASGEYHNGSSASSSRWHRESNDDPYARRGGFSSGPRPAFNRGRSRQDSDIPEWANEDVSEAAKASGGFDSSGKFSSSLDKPKRVINLNRDLREDPKEPVSAAVVPSAEDEAFEDEEVDVDDLPESMRKPTQVKRNMVDLDPHLDPMQHDLVSKLIEDDDPPMTQAASPPHRQQPHQNSKTEGPPVSSPPHPQTVSPGLVGGGNNGGPIPSVQQIQWYYLDPQGNEQGPFSSSDMLEWFEAGYFPVDLRLRRAGIDRRYAPLNEISRLYGRVPFTPGPAPGPLLPEQQQPITTPPPPQPTPSSAAAAVAAAAAAVVSTPPQPQLQNSPPINQQAALFQHMQQQQAMLQQQLLRQQQQLIAIQQQPHLSELEKAQLINKIMQLSILPGGAQQQPPPPPAAAVAPNLVKPSPSSSSNDISMLLKQQEQFAMKSPIQQQPQMMTSSAESGLQLLGTINNSHPTSSVEEPPFNPIKSLLRQLQQQHEQEHVEQPQQNSHSASPMQSEFMNQQQHQQQHKSPSPPPLQQHQSPQVPRSIWGDGGNKNTEPKPSLGVWGDDAAARESPNSFYNQVQQQREAGNQLQDDLDIDEFVKPKANEKKDKKAKRAEEKKRAREREAKKSAAANAANEFIPGMEGYIRSGSEDVAPQPTSEENLNEPSTQQGPYEDEMESGEPQQQQQPQYQPPKLAPWAKMSETTTSNGAESSLSLAEIQKLEEEREREAKMRREIAEAAQARARQEEEARRQQNIGLNWATAVNSMEGNGGQKSLAEIQAEEARQERERQERERREKKARQKNLSLAQASVWGSASTNLSWASKTAAAAAASSTTYAAPAQQQPPPPAPVPAQPAPQSNSFGFWDSNDAPAAAVAAASAPSNKASTQQSSNKKNKGKNNKLKEENKVASIFKESKGKPENEFEEWCINALEKLDPQVDIPTFLGFLNDVESPYEVNDYVKNYIGDGKGPKNFAKEYVERRSKWRNSLKSNHHIEDDLLMPAAAINPNEPDEAVPVVGGGLSGANSGSAAGGGGGGRRNKKKNKSKSKLDASHLLGFSVAAADRPNAGELDLPQ